MHDVVRCAINTADPMGLLKLGAPKDEYEPEIQDIVKVLASRPVNGVRDVQAALIDVFTQYFWADGIGPPTAYVEPAQYIWSSSAFQALN